MAVQPRLQQERLQGRQAWAQAPPPPPLLPPHPSEVPVGPEPRLPEVVDEGGPEGEGGEEDQEVAQDATGALVLDPVAQVGIAGGVKAAGGQESSR